MMWCGSSFQKKMVCLSSAEFASFSTFVQPVEQSAEVDQCAGDCLCSCCIQLVQLRDKSLRGAVRATETATAA